ncbi:hypothetical protein T08_4758 [Trichinella sp. T8]|nr:hypothetical protein T08_4758 [Trichinella sp. T8]
MHDSMKTIKGVLYYKSEIQAQMLLELGTLLAGNVFCIFVRYSLKLQSAVQYFFVLGKSIFLHFPSIWNQFIEIVSGRFEMPIKSSIY